MENLTVSNLRTGLQAFGLVALFIGLSVYPGVAFEIDFHDQDNLREARDELLRKQNQLLKEEDSLQREVNDLYAELKYKNDQLSRVESELRRTRNTLQDVERSMIRW